MQVRQHLIAVEPERALALVAGDKAPAVGKGVHRQAAAVRAALTDSRSRGMREAFELLRRDKPASGMRHCVKRRAVGPHEPRYRRSDDVVSELLLECAQNGIV